MKRTVVLVFLLAAAVGVAQLVTAGDKPAKARPDAKCPVSGEKISKDVAVEYKGGKVYFCCPACLPKFKEDTAKYEVEANEQLVLTGQAKQRVCPLTGRKLNESTKIEIDGIAVAFCCPNCQGKVKQAEAEKQREMIFGNKAFDKAFAVAKAKKAKKAEN